MIIKMVNKEIPETLKLLVGNEKMSKNLIKAVKSLIA